MVSRVRAYSKTSWSPGCRVQLMPRKLLACGEITFEAVRATAMAALRNLAIGVLYQPGRRDTTEATRWASRNMNRPFTILILGLTP
jgi:hypothetical protein